MKSNGNYRMNGFLALALAAAFSVCWGCDTQSRSGYTPPDVKASGDAPAEELEAIEPESEDEAEDLEAADESLDAPAGQPNADFDAQDDGSVDIEESSGDGDCGLHGTDMIPSDQENEADESR